MWKTTLHLCSIACATSLEDFVEGLRPSVRRFKRLCSRDGPHNTSPSPSVGESHTSDHNCSGNAERQHSSIWELCRSRRLRRRSCGVGSSLTSFGCCRQADLARYPPVIGDLHAYADGDAPGAAVQWPQRGSLHTNHHLQEPVRPSGQGSVAAERVDLHQLVPLMDSECVQAMGERCLSGPRAHRLVGQCDASARFRRCPETEETAFCAIVRAEEHDGALAILGRWRCEEHLRGLAAGHHGAVA